MKCSKCGKSGHNKRTCKKKVRKKAKKRARRRRRKNPTCSYCGDSHGAWCPSSRKIVHPNEFKPRRNRRRRFNPAVQSPGNFRPVTSGQTKQFLDDWKRQGVTSTRDFRGFEGSAKERKLDEIRFREAKHNWDSHLKSGKPLHYPAGGDFGDYMPISPGASRQYLNQFYTRQAQRLNEGLGMQDVTAYPFKPRYDEAAAVLGQDEADALASRIFDRHGYTPTGGLKKWGRRMPFRRSRRHRRRSRRNPFAGCPSCGFYGF